MFDFRFDHGRGKVDKDTFVVGSSSRYRPPDELFIGADRYNDSVVFLAGGLDDLRLYKPILDKEEVWDLYTAVAP